MTKIIGIDLGTTNSVVSLLEGTNSNIITNAEGSRITPSVVAFNAENECLVGEMALRQAVLNPDKTVQSVKRLMGRKYDAVPEEERKSYPMAEALNGDAALRIAGKLYSPEEISAKILIKLKEAAEKYVNEKITDAVITVPAYFNDLQRKATQNAGEIAGLNVRRIINEPTAAALAFGADKHRDMKIAVYDFGGGTFDISILEIGDGVVEVLSTAGDTRLGGDDIDNLIVAHLLSEFKQASGLDVGNDGMVLQRLRDAARKAKCELSSVVNTDINLPFLTADASGPKHLQVSLSRAKLEQMMSELIDRTFACCDTAMSDAGVKPSELDEILLVGGSTRIPYVVERVKQYFGKVPNCTINPDEAVAMGAAIQGGILSGNVTDILLLDVTPLSLGIEAQRGIMVKLIEKNTTIPAKKSKIFSTTTDNQTSVCIKVFQGEHEFTERNRYLGQFELSDIELAPRAVPQIEVAFDIDANGVVKVSATNLKSKKNEELVLTGAGGLTDDEIRKAVKEAEDNAESERIRREESEDCNRIQSLIFNMQRLLRRYESELEKKIVDEALAAIDKGNAVMDSPESDHAARFEVIQLLSSHARLLYEFEDKKQAAEAKPSEAKNESDRTASEDGEGRSEN